MQKIMFLSEVVQSSRSGGGGWELCVTADVKYDATAAALVIELDSLVQPVDLPPGVIGFRQPWLPTKEVVKRRVPLRKARAVARGAFRRWTTKVRGIVFAHARHPAD